MHQIFNGTRKSLYLFLTCLLGLFLFFILHRAVVFIYLYLVATGNFVDSFVYWRFMALDYFTLVLALMGGAWYGIWLGSFWYAKVYEEGSHGGFVSHLASRLGTSPKSSKNLSVKLASVKEHLEKDLWQLEDLAKTTLTSVKVAPAPKIRRVVRKRAPKKLKAV